MSPPLFSSETFRAYAALLLQLTRCWDDEDAADTVRDALDAMWDELSPAEQLEARGLASDLNWARRGPAPRSPGIEGVTPESLKALRECIERGDHGPERLRLLRACAPLLPAAWLASRRANTWVQHQLYDLALFFFEHARTLEPENQEYALKALWCLNRLDHSKAMIRAEQILAHPRSAALGEVVEALLLRSVALPPAPSPDVLGVLAGVAVETAHRLRLHDATYTPFMITATCLVGALSLGSLGQPAAAFELLEIANREGGGPNQYLVQQLLAQRSAPPELFMRVVEISRRQLVEAPREHPAAA